MATVLVATTITVKVPVAATEPVEATVPVACSGNADEFHEFPDKLKSSVGDLWDCGLICVYICI